MDSPNNLEVAGNVQTNPLAELLIEIAQIKLNGSLRLSNAAQKIVIYFDAGDVVFAVSNARQHRLFEMLLQAGEITKEQLVSISDFTNDSVLKENLLANKLLEKSKIDALFSRQINDILQTVLAWRIGEWRFSPLVRIKGDVRFSVDTRSLLIEYARSLPAEEARRRFKNPLESLSATSAMPAGVNPSPTESFVFSRFENAALTIEEIQNLSGLPEAATFQILYALWLGGFVLRQNPYPAFSERDISAILSAKLTVKKEEIKPTVQPPTINTETPPTETKTQEPTEEIAAIEKEISVIEKEISVEEYLERTAKATNFYEIFALAPDAAASEIKQTYFGLARRFHPDLFYKETDALRLRQIQDAFTQLAQAYETLKTASSRELYDFKMRKELAEMKIVEESGVSQEEFNVHKQIDQAAENFEQGFSSLMDENYDIALPFLARAVYFAKDNARYHAYYGKALAMNNKSRHQAEAELQTAIKLDAINADFRIMLAEFFVQAKLLKRAKGELNRLLAIHPNNREAQTLLDSLKKK